MKNSCFLNKIIHGVCLDVLRKMEDSSIDVVLTDPPYFFDKMDKNWQYKRVQNTKNQHTIKSLPAGMKFDPKQGKEFYKWYLKVSSQLYRVLKSGAFFLSFSSPRLYHRMACAVDDAGFEIRDCFLWLYTQNQAKAMGIDHFIEKMSIDKAAKKELKRRFSGWKTPQLKSCYEPIVVAQKPTDGTYLNNMIKNSVGLMNTNVQVGENMFPSNVITVDGINEILDKYFLIGKPSKKEKGLFNDHKTVKPIELCRHLICLTAFFENATILDPFVGSGTTSLAAKSLGLNFIGIDVNNEYVTISNKRLKQLDQTEEFELYKDEFRQQRIKFAIN